jgi:cell division septal protein FtsQ
MDEHTHKTNNLQEEYSNPKHSVRHKQIERKIRKKRKKISQAKAFLRFVTLLLLVFLSYEFFKLPQWYLNPKAFKKADGHTVEIVNNKIIPTYIINKSLINVKVSRLPIFMVSVKPIKKEIFKQSVIKKVYVRRYGFPARVQIIVEERVPIALIKTDLKAKPVALFTEDGKLLEAKSYMNLPNDDDILKILTSATNLKKDWSVKRVREIEEVVKAVEEYSDEQVEYIDMRNPNDVFVKIKTTSIRLGALDSTVFERIKRIYTILPQIKGVDSHIKYIDLSWDKVNYLKLDKKK